MEWKKVPDDSVKTVWTCPHEDCTRHGQEKTVGPAFFEDSGTPICDECGDDLKYLRTEVRLPGAGVAKVAAVLAHALEDVMASEGGEPTTYSKGAWRAAEKALKAWQKSIS